MRALLRTVSIVLGLLSTTLAAQAAAFTMAGSWTGSITPKAMVSVTTNVTLRDGGSFTISVLRQPGAYSYTGRWAYASGRISLTFSDMSPHNTTKPFWPVGDKEIGTVQVDKSNPNKIYVRFEGDPWLMTLFRR